MRLQTQERTRFKRRKFQKLRPNQKEYENKKTQQIMPQRNQKKWKCLEIIKK